MMQNIMNNSKKNEKIELRSVNTQRFVIEEPPLFIRYGTIIIVFLLTIVSILLYCLN